MLDFDHEAVQVARSYAFVCYSCGEVFARARRGNSTFIAYRAVCPSCEPEAFFWNWLPGSIWLDWDNAFNDALPDAVVAREFELHLAWWEKEIEDEQVTEGNTASKILHERA